MQSVNCSGVLLFSIRNYLIILPSLYRCLIYMIQGGYLQAVVTALFYGVGKLGKLNLREIAIIPSTELFDVLHTNVK